MRIAQAAAYAYELPLTAPMTGGNRDLVRRSGWLVRLQTSEGREGWGDAAPLPGFSREGPNDARRDLAEVLRALPDLECPDDNPIGEVGRRFPRICSSVRFAVETAVWTAVASDRPASFLWSRAEPVVPLTALLAGPDAQVLDRARALASHGYRSAKLKVGRASPEADAALVRQVQAALGPSVTLCADANRAWSLEDARRFARAVDDVALAYVEEPMKDPTDLRAFHGTTGLYAALDETLHADDAEGWLALPGLKAIVVKPTVAGGLQRARALWHKAEGRGILSVVSSAFESGVGLRALVWLAAGLRGSGAGLDTYRWLASDVLEPRLDLEKPSIVVDAMTASHVMTARLGKEL